MSAVNVHDLITYVDSKSIEWQEIRPGARQKMLFHNPATGQKAFLVEFAPGYRSEPAPPHEWGEYVYVLEGVFEDEHQASPAGTYIHNAPGSIHQPRSAAGCTFFVYVPGSRADEK